MKCEGVEGCQDGWLHLQELLYVISCHLLWWVFTVFKEVLILHILSFCKVSVLERFYSEIDQNGHNTVAVDSRMNGI